MTPRLRPSFSPRWWSAALPDVVAQSYRTAQAWKNDSPPVPPLHLVYEDWWWVMAAEHQIAEAHEQLTYNGAADGVAHVRDQISRRYGVDAQKFAGTPDDLNVRLAAIVAERGKTPAPDAHLDRRRRTIGQPAPSSGPRRHYRATPNTPSTATAPERPPRSTPSPPHGRWN